MGRVVRVGGEDFREKTTRLTNNPIINTNQTVSL